MLMEQLRSNAHGARGAVEGRQLLQPNFNPLFMGTLADSTLNLIGLENQTKRSEHPFAVERLTAVSFQNEHSIWFCRLSLGQTGQIT